MVDVIQGCAELSGQPGQVVSESWKLVGFARISRTGKVMLIEIAGQKASLLFVDNVIDLTAGYVRWIKVYQGNR